MATFTVTAVNQEGNMKTVHGTFTTTTGDTTVSLGATTHGLNYIVDRRISLDTGAVGAQTPKISVSSGTVTATYDNTWGYSGTFYVKGR